MRRMISGIAMLLAAASLSACATKYQNMGFMGGVEAEALKAAETTIAAGETHFAIIGGEDTSKREVDYDPGVANTVMFGTNRHYDV